MQTDNGDEILDLVDDDDTVIGSMSREEVYSRELYNFRVVNIFLINSKGELWIPRRTSHKKMFPLYLDMSAAGHVSSGESYEEAAIKETAEEVSIDLTKTPYRSLGKLSPQDGVSAHMKTYEVLVDGVPDYSKEDFCEYYWLTPQDLLNKIEGGDNAKSDLPILVKRYYITKKPG